MTFPVDQILNLPEMKVLDCQEIEGIGIVITIEKSVNYFSCPLCKQITQALEIFLAYCFPGLAR